MSLLYDIMFMSILSGNMYSLDHQFIINISDLYHMCKILEGQRNLVSGSQINLNKIAFEIS